MAKKSVEELGTLQAATLEAVWALGEGTVHQVREHLAKDKPLAYTTVLTALQKLEKGGWLTHRAEGRSYVYVPTATQRQSVTASALRLVKNSFGGDPLRLFRQLLDARPYSDDELAELRRMIAAKRKEQKDA
ncbi:Predicted transcriptional regulator [Singulisphaera sp. GP187]|uniref:BlaI/MecI/CopY family transcriptional regulator n=1 Tax=Singulisphaera sp. GP187 TaxID=1882752 RepID=UPI00092B57D1|nr:BlaI/MecI/CopY family transcriptional regulator [Singulisphaera sp. GP187]SIO41200.1 Predicted transcriptional regulator [Singulisphaera sp. GP187]